MCQISFQTFGEVEPFLNSSYHFLYKNITSFNEQITLLDYFIFLICLLPNSLLNLYSHFFDKIPEFFTQNYCILNLIVFYYRGSLDLIALGIFNIIVILTIFSADEELYNQFPIWFDFLGINPIKIF
jgi:hypothetical protein